MVCLSEPPLNPNAAQSIAIIVPRAWQIESDSSQRVSTSECQHGTGLGLFLFAIAFDEGVGGAVVG
jgi:hypothetical protein